MEAVIRVHGGVKFYRGAPRAARAYVEQDRSRADDYYLAEGNGVATRLVATPGGVRSRDCMTGEVYEQWVAGFDLETMTPKGHIRTDDNALRFVEVVVNGPKTWSLAAALHPEVSAVFKIAFARRSSRFSRSSSATRTAGSTGGDAAPEDPLGGLRNQFRNVAPGIPSWSPTW